MTSSTQAPLITVYMPTHNRIDLLPRAVNSVLGQDHENLELIIVNDGSKDGTHDWLEALQKRESRVRVFQLAVAKGPSHARNLAISQAKGEFITGIDDDDEFLSNRLSLFLKNWDKEYAFVTSSIYWDYGQSRKLLGGKKIDITLSDLLSHKNGNNQVFTRPQRLIDAGLFDETMRKSEDWDLWIRLGRTKLPMKQIAEATYIIHTAHESPRLSLNISGADGIRRLIAKHQDVMSSRNHKDMAIMLAITERRTLPFFKLLPLLTLDNTSLYGKFWVRQKLPFLTRIMRKIRNR